ncbi:MAG TPA: HAMP domain-containing sensor histidine kinase [Chloroflexota bacterium]
MSARAAHDLDDRDLRRVRVRLAALTAVMLSVLLLGLGLFIYVTMKNALLQPARQAVQARANAEGDYIAELERTKRGGEAADASSELEQGGVFINFADQNLHVLGNSVTPFGRALPSPAAARAVLTSRSPSFTSATARGQDYLIYSKPVEQHGRVIGVVQTGISEHQYEAGLQSLLEVLAIVGALSVIAIAGITALVVRRALLPIRTSLRRQREFVADAAHELRTPLTIICTAAELGLTSDNTESQQEALEHALAEGNHLKRLVDDLSLLARTDSGALNLACEEVDMSALIGRTVADLDLLAQDCGVRLIRDLPAPLYILGDSDRLRQLLVVLLDNALKHSTDGSDVRITLSRHSGQMELRIQDDGPGIAPADLPHLFDRFYRSDRSRSRGEGTGLGLAIARWIVEAHGGEIRAGNAPDGGALFTVVFPLAPHSTATKATSATA